jgi:chromo domain-containing protein 1
MSEGQSGSPNQEGLFVESWEPTVPLSSHAKQPPVPRRAPFQQSSSEGEENSDSDMHTSDDSLMSELRKKRKIQRKVDRSAAKSASGNSTLQPKRSKKTGESDMVNVENHGRESRSSNATTNPSIQVREDNSPESPIYKKTAQQLTVPAGSSGVKDCETVVSTTTSKSTANRSPNATTMRAIRTAPKKQKARGINIVDQPKEPKKQWSTDNHFSKVRFRYLAEKRSRTEGTPDFNALDFVHGPPPTLPKATTSLSNSDPYGRRDITNRRVQEEDPEDRPRRGLAHDPVPLADWEADKVPLMCASWRLSRNCPYGALRCVFMHRDLDPQGREYPMGDIEGWVPYKYRKPPITCPFWYRGYCTKSAEQCVYAHENTGWAELKGEPIRIDHLPEAFTAPIVRDGPPDLVLFKHLDPPITCSYWLRDPNGCSKSDEVCKYAHWNTGWAPPENDIRGKPVRIDPNQVPRGGPPKYANPPVTCPFWLRSERGCIRTDEECRYAHRNTGWAPPQLSSGQPVQIDPHELPVNQRSKNAQDTVDPSPLHSSVNDQHVQDAFHTAPSGSQLQPNKAITCPYWLRDPDGCAKLDEECDLAHRNTGWAAPKGRPFDPPVPLDPNQVPRSHRDRLKGKLGPVHNLQPVHHYGSHDIEPKHAHPPITCFFWLRGSRGCAKSDEACRFAHTNTGWMTGAGKGKNSHPEQINPREGPRFRDYGKCSN